MQKEQIEKKKEIRKKVRREKKNKHSTGGNLYHEYTCAVHNQLFIHYCIVHAWLASEIKYYYKQNNLNFQLSMRT